jgi:hypothetical protein
VIYAKVNVDLYYHQRVLAVPRATRAAALGTWLVALLYTRGKELDGFVPAEVLEPCVRCGQPSAICFGCDCWKRQGAARRPRP